MTRILFLPLAPSCPSNICAGLHDDVVVVSGNAKILGVCIVITRSWIFTIHVILENASGDNCARDCLGLKVFINSNL